MILHRPRNVRHALTWVSLVVVMALPLATPLPGAAAATASAERVDAFLVGRRAIQNPTLLVRALSWLRTWVIGYGATRAANRLIDGPELTREDVRRAIADALNEASRLEEKGVSHDDLDTFRLFLRRVDARLAAAESSDDEARRLISQMETGFGSRFDDVEQRLEELLLRVSDLSAELARLEARVDENEARSRANTAAIGQNREQIEVNAGDIRDNREDINTVVDLLRLGSHFQLGVALNGHLFQSERNQSGHHFQPGVGIAVEFRPDPVFGLWAEYATASESIWALGGPSAAGLEPAKYSVFRVGAQVTNLTLRSRSDRLAGRPTPAKFGVRGGVGAAYLADSEKWGIGGVLDFAYRHGLRATTGMELVAGLSWTWVKDAPISSRFSTSNLNLLELRIGYRIMLLPHRIQ